MFTEEILGKVKENLKKAEEGDERDVRLNVARHLCDIVIEEFPDSLQGRASRAHANFYLGNFADVLDDYAALIKLDPGNYQIYFNRGITLSRMGKDQEAIEDYKQAIKIIEAKGKPNEKRLEMLINSYLSKADALSRLGLFEEAIADCTRVIEELDPDNVNAYHGRAVLFYRSGEVDKAIPDCSYIIEKLDPKNVIAHNTRALAYSRAGRLKEAIADYTKIIEELDEKCSSAHINRAVSFFYTGEHEKGLEDLNAALKIGANLDTVFATRAIFSSTEGKFEEGIEYCDKAIKSSKDDSLIALALSNKAEYLFLLGRTDESKVAAEEALRKDKDFIPPYFSLGNYFLAAGDKRKAEENYTKVIQMVEGKKYPRDAEYYAAIGSAFKLSGALMHSEFGAVFDKLVEEALSKSLITRRQVELIKQL